jgi:hypothetical protein
MKPLSEFNRKTGTSTGRQSYCRICDREHATSPAGKLRARVYDRSEAGKTRYRVYAASVAGIAKNLRSDHGYTLAESRVLAVKLLAETSKCEICGTPGWLIRLNHRKGGPFLSGTEKQNRRIHPDRVDTTKPHTLSNTRLLCPACNLRRGAEKYTDEEVLRWVRERWLSIFNPRMLWWLNTEPGKGGRERRNPNAH